MFPSSSIGTLGGSKPPEELVVVVVVVGGSFGVVLLSGLRDEIDFLGGGVEFFRKTLC